jgi:hypothetical protein
VPSAKSPCRALGSQTLRSLSLSEGADLPCILLCVLDSQHMTDDQAAPLEVVLLWLDSLELHAIAKAKSAAKEVGRIHQAVLDIEESPDTANLLCEPHIQIVAVAEGDLERAQLLRGLLRISTCCRTPIAGPLGLNWDYISDEAPLGSNWEQAGQSAQNHQ